MDRIERLSELRREVAPYPNSAACKVLHHLLTMMIEVLREEQLTTAQTTPAPVSTVATGWGVEESINPGTNPSLQLDLVDTKNGPVGHNSECAHMVKLGIQDNETRVWADWCKNCGALTYQGKILVPAAARISSTSAKQDLKQSAESSYGAFAVSPSNESNSGLTPGGSCRV